MKRFFGTRVMYLLLVSFLITGSYIFADSQPTDTQEILPADETPDATGAKEAPQVRGEGPVYVIPIHGEINRSLMIFLRRNIERARNDNASLIIFEIDTFGGRVDSALQITTMIGSLDQITTVAYVPVRPEGTAVSWSAGALISFACDAIYMAAGTSMGSAAPVMAGPDGSAALADEKAVSAIRVQMAAIAEKNSYPRAIALAMVDQDMEVIEVFVDDEARLVTASEKEDLQRRLGDDLIIGETVSPKGKLLSLTAGDMERFGISSGTYTYRSEVINSLGVADRQVFERTPSDADRLVALLTGSALTSMLIFIGIMALFMEITSPGFGIPGAIGVLCFSILFATNALLGTVSSLELLLFVAGLVLLIVEIFIIPGFGVAGLSGIGLIAASLILAMQDFIIPTFSWEWQRFNQNILLVTGNIIGAFITFGVLAYFIPKYTPFRRLALSLSQEAAAGYTVQTAQISDELTGKKGWTITNLRPSGKAEFGSQVMQVETEGEYIEKDMPVKVLRADGNRIVVRLERKKPRPSSK